MLVTVSDVRDVERRTHTLEGLAYVRAPEGGTWEPLLVVRGSITINPLGTLPSRTCNITVLGWTNTLDDIFDVASIYGSWLRLHHKVTRTNGTYFTAPLGYFRLNAATPHYLDGSVDLAGEDAGCLTQDMALQTLKEGQVLTTETYVDRISYIMRQPLAGIVPWWTDPDGFDPGVSPPTTKPKARIQREGSRVDAAEFLTNAIGREISMPLTGASAYKLVIPRDAGDPSDVTVRGGELGNLVEATAVMDRRGIVNTALMKYTTETPTAGARTVIRQRRIVTSYVDADSDVRSGGPFGRITLDVNSTNTITDVEAEALSTAAIRQTLTVARDYTVSTGPIYGLESGDIIRVQNMEGTGQRGVLVGGTIGLTAEDAWSLTVRMYNSVGRWGRTPRVTFSEATDVKEVRDDADWVDVASKTVDTTGNSKKGWNATGGALTDGGAHMVFKSNGSATTEVGSSNVFTMPAEHRIRVRFNIRSKTRTIYIRSYVDPNQAGRTWTPKRTKIEKDHTRTVSADVTVGTGGTFSVGFDVSLNADGSGTLPANTLVWISEVDVAIAKRQVQ